MVPIERSSGIGNMTVRPTKRRYDRFGEVCAVIAEQKRRWTMKHVSGRVLVLAFVYWLVFLLVLEPGNAVRLAQVGQNFPVVHEVLRILAASVLGMAATPLLFPFSAADWSANTARR